jgi:hypothetical protein
VVVMKRRVCLAGRLRERGHVQLATPVVAGRGDFQSRVYRISPTRLLNICFNLDLLLRFTALTALTI